MTSAFAPSTSVDNGANVISMSSGSETPSTELQQAIRYANSHGVTCVAAAGNEGEQEVAYPAGGPRSARRRYRGRPRCWRK